MSNYRSSKLNSQMFGTSEVIQGNGEIDDNVIPGNFGHQGFKAWTDGKKSLNVFISTGN